MSRHLLLLLSGVLLLFSCHSVPDHARYIPKDATTVIGVNTNVLSKKIAWSAITGSKLLDELEKGADAGDMRQKAEALKDAGISYNSTLYFYHKADNRYPGNNKMVLVLPLSSESKWEDFLKKNFKDSPIAPQKDFKTALIDDKAMAGWNEKVLIIQNPMRLRTTELVPVPAPEDSTGESAPEMVPSEGWGGVDEAATLSELQNAFSMKKENSVLKDDHFSTLAKQGDDISVFVNYEQFMNTMNGMGMGAAVAQPLFQNTAFTAGINFKNGLIESDMRYYPSENMKEITQKLGSKNVDQDLTDRLPGNNLGMVLAYHLDPAGLSAALDKMGLTGLANLSLSSQGLNLDEILGAFTGDLAFTINNFRVEESKMEVDSFMLQFMDTTDLTQREPAMDLLFVLKIKNKATVDKLLRLAQQSGLKSMGNGVYQLGNNPEDGQLLVNNDYIVAGNNTAMVQAFSTHKTAQKLPQPAREIVTGHPLGYYMDIQAMLQQVPAPTGRGKAAEAAMLAGSKKMFRSIELAGGEFRHQASNFQLKVNLMDKSENALLQLLQLVQEVAAANQLDQQEKDSDVVAGNYQP